LKKRKGKRVEKRIIYEADNTHSKRSSKKLRRRSGVPICGQNKRESADLLLETQNGGQVARNCNEVRESCFALETMGVTNFVHGLAGRLSSGQGGKTL